MGYDTSAINRIDDDEDDWLLIRAALRSAQINRRVEAPLEEDDSTAQARTVPGRPTLLSVKLTHNRTGVSQYPNAARSTDWRKQPPIMVLTVSASLRRTNSFVASDQPAKLDRMEEINHRYRQLLRHWINGQLE